jgi:hypothetical protein
MMLHTAITTATAAVGTQSVTQLLNVNIVNVHIHQLASVLLQYRVYALLQELVDLLRSPAHELSGIEQLVQGTVYRSEQRVPAYALQ